MSHFTAVTARGRVSTNSRFNFLDLTRTALHVRCDVNFPISPNQLCLAHVLYTQPAEKNENFCDFSSAVLLFESSVNAAAFIVL